MYGMNSESYHRVYYQRSPALEASLATKVNVCSSNDCKFIIIVVQPMPSPTSLSSLTAAPVEYV